MRQPCRLAVTVDAVVVWLGRGIELRAATSKNLKTIGVPKVAGDIRSVDVWLRGSLCEVK